MQSSLNCLDEKRKTNKKLLYLAFRLMNNKKCLNSVWQYWLKAHTLKTFTSSTVVLRIKNEKKQVWITYSNIKNKKQMHKQKTCSYTERRVHLQLGNKTQYWFSNSESNGTKAPKQEKRKKNHLLQFAAVCFRSLTLFVLRFKIQAGKTWMMKDWKLHWPLLLARSKLTQPHPLMSNKKKRHEAAINSVQFAVICTKMQDACHQIAAYFWK